MILIFCTFETEEEAEKIGGLLLKEKLIACFSTLPVKSAYRWKGKIAKTKEVMAILKSDMQNFEEIEILINKHSSYETPEIVAVSPAKVNKPYLNWLDAEIK